MTLNFPNNPSVGDRYSYGDTIWAWNGNAWDNVSSSAVAYHYVQNTPSSSWTITHNLNFYPNITTMDSSGSIVEGEIEHLNRNTVRVTFLAAFSGEAFLS